MMSNREITSNADSLVYFKPAGVILQKHQFLDLLLSSSVLVEVSLVMEPMFYDNAPVPDLKCDIDLRMVMVFNMNNSSGAFSSSNSKAEIGLFMQDLKPLRNFPLPAKKKEKNMKVGTSEESNDDAGEDEVVMYRAASSVLLSKTITEPINESFSLSLLSMSDSETDETSSEAKAKAKTTLRTEAWFDKLAASINKYARLTDFILQAGDSTLIGDKDAEAVNPLLMKNPLKASQVEEEENSGSTILPIVSKETLDSKRNARQEVMDEIRKKFRISNRIVMRVPLSSLNDYPNVKQVLNILFNKDNLLYPSEIEAEMDKFFTDNIASLFQASVTEII